MEKLQDMEERKQDQLLTAIIPSCASFLTCHKNIINDVEFFGGMVEHMCFQSKSDHDQVVNKDNEALWPLKAYNGRVVCAWLATCAVELSRAKPLDEEVAVLAACMPCP